MKLKYITVSLLLMGLVACNNKEGAQSKEEEKTETLFTLLEPEETGVTFINKVQNQKNFNIFKYRNFYNGGGVAIGDINNDGLADIYLTANMGSNKLFLNKGNFTFEDVTQKSKTALSDHWSTGVVFVDLNHDGLLDIYVCNAGFVKGQNQKNALFINQGNMLFEEQAAMYGLDESGYTTHAAFFDYDKDGDLDAYILNNSFIPTNTLNYSNKRNLRATDWPVKDFLKGGGDKLLENQDNKFVDVSEKAGIYQSLIGFGLGVTVGDVNEDGYEDLYISNDFFERDYLYLNQKDGTFAERLEDYFEHISHSSMGADMRDINNDGLPDIFVTDMLPDEEYRLKTTASFDDINLRNLKIKQGFYNQFMHNTLQLNKGGKFKEIAFHSGVAASDWSWGALMFDADNDRYTDLLVCNGIFHDVINLDFMDFFANDIMQQMVLSGKKEDVVAVIDKMPSTPLQNKFFKNIGEAKFEEVSTAWGLPEKTFSNGAAYGDLDNDGDYDLVINNVNQPALLYKNNATNHALQIRLVGPSGNPDAIGSKVFVYDTNEILSRQVHPGRGFQSSVDYKLIFGLGEQTAIDSIKIIWPDQKESFIYNNIQADTLLVFEYGDAVARKGEKIVAKKIFTEISHDIVSHEEDDWVDYYYERGLYRLLSKEGPKSCVADVNGDGQDDLFICGAKDKPSMIYMQQNGKLEISEQVDMGKHLLFEDVTATFFDADGDGDQDLVVGTGGNRMKPNEYLLRDRLYLNDGNGGFRISMDFKPKKGMNTAKIIAWDYDVDGDQDLLCFSRSTPRHFGYRPIHALYDNDGNGIFTKVNSEQTAAFEKLGMVTDATLANIDKDDREEIVIIGEFAAPIISRYDGKKFIATKTNLSQLHGWYYSVAATDIDGDGDQDLIFGNHGTNNYLQASEAAPVHLWVHDFDNNKTTDKILTYRKGAKDFPVMLKKEIADQVAAIKKQNIKHADFATKSIPELFPKTDFAKVGKYQLTYMKSFVAKNEGDGQHFEIIPLPFESQLSSIHSILPVDYDNDGDMDLLTGGNDYHLIPQFSRLDASFGALLKNDGKGNFHFVDEQDSGIWIDGEIRDINVMELAGKEVYVFSRNGLLPVLLQRIIVNDINNQ